MKLSDAILMNGMEKPQGFGYLSMYSHDAPCALGGACQSHGLEQDYISVAMTWKWTSKSSRYTCPVCEEPYPCAYPMDAIIHLNDAHFWSRAQIAEWVASVEPPEPTENVADVEVAAEMEVAK